MNNDFKNVVVVIEKMECFQIAGYGVVEFSIRQVVSVQSLQSFIEDEVQAQNRIFTIFGPQEEDEEEEDDEEDESEEDDDEDEDEDNEDEIYIKRSNGVRRNL